MIRTEGVYDSGVDIQVSGFLVQDVKDSVIRVFTGVPRSK